LEKSIIGYACWHREKVANDSSFVTTILTSKIYLVNPKIRQFSPEGYFEYSAISYICFHDDVRTGCIPCITVTFQVSSLVDTSPPTAVRKVFSLIAVGFVAAGVS
jgi:hypothetical protein